MTVLFEASLPSGNEYLMSGALDFLVALFFVLFLFVVKDRFVEDRYTDFFLKFSPFLATIIVLIINFVPWLLHVHYYSNYETGKYTVFEGTLKKKKYLSSGRLLVDVSGDELLIQTSPITASCLSTKALEKLDVFLMPYDFFRVSFTSFNSKGDPKAACVLKLEKLNEPHGTGAEKKNR